MEIVHEEWRPVKGCEGKFEVSNAGQVKILARSVRHWCGRSIPKPERLVKQSRHSGGYRVVALDDGKKHFVHRLVMAAFVGDPPTNMNDVNHINGNKADNRRENLEYCNRLHNVRHAIRTGLQDNSGENNGGNKYTAAAVSAARDMVRNGVSQAKASRITGVHAETVRMAVNGQRWKCLDKELSA